MHVARNIIQGGSAALIGGSLLGLIEAVYLLIASGAPDLVSPLYAVVLYGLLALPFGLATGVAVSVLERILLWEKLQRGVRRSLTLTEGHAWGMGLAGATFPLGVFVIAYTLNKVVFAEAGMLQAGLIGLAVMGVLALLFAFVLPYLLNGPLKLVLEGIGLLGIWGGMLLVTIALTLVPLGDDPRDFAHGKATPEALADKPDVLFIMVDALRADHIAAWGRMDIETPNLDALAADGLLFERAYANASWTRSSTASMWTGRIPSGHNGDTKASRLPDEVVTWGEALRPAGVVTGALANNINITETFNFDQGFDSFLYESPEYPYLATESVFSLTLYKLIHKASERIFSGNKKVERFYQPAEVVHADAMAFMTANADSRWALFIHDMEPHDPYFEHPYNGVGYARAEHEHPDPGDTEYLKRVYKEEVEFYDGELGALLQGMKDEGIYDSTVIVLTADHGEEFYEHGGFWHGTTLYDEQLHVPLIVKLAHGERAGTRVPWQVRLIDIPPTLTDLMGVAPDPSWEGRSLLDGLESLDPEAEGEAVGEDEDEGEGEGEGEEQDEGEDEDEGGEEELPPPPPTPAECFDARAHPLDRPLVAEEDFEGNVLSALQRNGLSYMRANAGNPRGLPEAELFDMIEDSGQRSNLLDGGSAICGSYPDAHASTFAAEIDLVTQAAAGTAAQGGTATMSAAECENLKALGYLGADEPCGP